MLFNTIALYLLIIIVVTSFASEVAIVKAPSTQTVLIGETATFQCEAEADLILFFIDGTISADKIEAVHLGFLQTDIQKIDQQTIYRNLTVVTSYQNNNTFIDCRAFIHDQVEVKVSQPAQLLLEEVSILYPPQMKNGTWSFLPTFVNSITTLTCVARAITIDFLIDGLSADYQSNHAKGFNQSSISRITTFANQTHIRRTLNVNSSVENNMTVISCRAINSLSSEDTDVKFRHVKILIVLEKGSTSAFHLQQDLLSDASQSSSYMESSGAESSNIPDVEIEMPPEAATVLENEKAVFTCAVKAKEITFLINGKSIANYKDNGGFTMNYTTPSPDKTIQYRQLETVGSKKNNNTKITCLAFTFYTIVDENNGTTYHKSTNMSSDPVVLLVQGPPTAVPKLYVDWLNKSNAKITWDPPYTLPGINITGYKLSFVALENDKEKVIPDKLVYHSDENFYPWRNTSCCRVIISAYIHGLDDGEKSSRLVVPPPSVTIRNYPINTANENISFSLILNISDTIACFDEFQMLIDVKIKLANEKPVFRNFSDVNLLNLKDNILISDMITLPANNEYKGQVRYTLSQGQGHHFSSEIGSFYLKPPLSIVSLSSSKSNTQRFQCEFGSDVVSDIQGCLISLSSDNGYNINGSANKTYATESKLIVSLPFDGEDGEYLLEGYIIEESTGLPVFVYIDHIQVTHNEVVVSSATIIPSPSPTPTVFSSSTVSPSSTPTDGPTTSPPPKTKGLSKDAIGILIASLIIVLLVILFLILCLFYNWCIKKENKQLKGENLKLKKIQSLQPDAGDGNEDQQAVPAAADTGQS